MQGVDEGGFQFTALYLFFSSAQCKGVRVCERASEGERMRVSERHCSSSRPQQTAEHPYCVWVCVSVCVFLCPCVPVCCTRVCVSEEEKERERKRLSSLARSFYRTAASTASAALAASGTGLPR